MAVQERYVTDNPFRALTLGAATDFASLRRKADGTARAASVGLAPKVPMSELFGSLELAQLASTVRSLGNDREHRTAFRLMWPLSDGAIHLLTDGGSLKRDFLAEEEQAQLFFLSAWYAFLEDGGASDAAEALERWHLLQANEVMCRRLANLVVREDGISEQDAYECVRSAEKTIALHLLGRVASAAAQKWDLGDTSTGSVLARALLNSPNDDSLEEKALTPLVECGQRLDYRVTELIRNMPEWRRGNSVNTPREVVQLRRLGELLSRRHPSTADWIETAQRWETSLISKIRNESLRLNAENQNAESLAVLKEALRLVTDSEQKAKLQRDETALREILDDEKREAAFAGIQKIGSAPIMRTLNGIGTSLYGNEPFAGDPKFYFAVLYFVVVFVPIFPLKRYLVADAGGGGWRFLGKTSWTWGMKVHLVVTCVVMAIMGFGMAHPNSHSEALNQASTNPGTSSETSAFVPSPVSVSDPEIDPQGPTVRNDNSSTRVPNAEPVNGKPLQGSANTNIDYDKWLAERNAKGQERDNLEKKLAELKDEVDRLDSEVAASAANLATKRSSLKMQKATVDSMKPGTIQQEIDDYNALVDGYERLRADFNASVVEHNRKVNEQKRKVRKYNELVGRFNSLR